jgi:hypothetical protein
MKPRTDQETAPAQPEKARRKVQARRDRFDSNQASGTRNALEDARRHPPESGSLLLPSILRKWKRDKANKRSEKL